MSKQDRQGVRTPADIERKYDLGRDVSEVEKIAISAQRIATDADRKAEKAVASADLASAKVDNMSGQVNSLSASVSNRNLIDNWYFAKPVNQRGATSYSDNDVITIDRWKSFYMKVDVNTGYITLTKIVPEYGCSISQKHEDLSWLIGKTVTASLLDASGNLYTHTFNLLVAGANSGYVDRYAFYVDTNTMHFSIGLGYTELSSSGQVKAVKFEVGNRSTLLADIPPDFQQELAKCKRYHQKITQNIPMVCVSASNKYLRGTLISPVEMVGNPSIKHGNASWIYMSGFDTSTKDKTTVENLGVYGNAIDIRVTLPSNINPTLNTVYLVAVVVEIGSE